MKDSDRSTALHHAVEGKGGSQVVEALVAAGANLEARKDFGYTPLALAAKRDKAEAIKALLAAGADPNVKGANGATPLMTAAGRGNEGAVKLLL